MLCSWPGKALGSQRRLATGSPGEVPPGETLLVLEEENGKVWEEIESPYAPPGADELYHLVQDDELIGRIHSEELPPDEYYDKLGDALKAKFPGATPSLIEHVVSLTSGFDTAASFALSFGIAKFQLGQTKVKLVGEYVGREGRSPNPELVSAVKKWPPINNLKDLQSFLGTANYARPHMGPAYARVAHPLRSLLTPKAVWPLNSEQLKAVQGLKDLLVEQHLLAVPDERAAIDAAESLALAVAAAPRAYA